MPDPWDDPVPRVVLADDTLRAVLPRATTGPLRIEDPVARGKLVEWGLVRADAVRPGVVHVTAEGLLFLSTR